MQLPDVNVLIYAHREDADEHEAYAAWLENLVNHEAPFAVSEIVLSSFLRIVSNPKIFTPATPMNVALEFCERLVAWPRSVPVLPTERHWALFTQLCRDSQIKGAMVSDAYLAALAIEHGCELVTTDSDFARFAGLRWRHPLSAATGD
jgi:toxin-antitoxin system PIN domain toxin